MKKLLLVAGGVALLVALALSLLEVSLSSRVAFRSCQPRSIDYRSFGPYCMGLVERRLLGTRHCELRIVREDDSLVDGYGFGLTPWASACPRSPAVAWASESVTLEVVEPPHGVAQRVMIPREAFVGGR